MANEADFQPADLSADEGRDSPASTTGECPRSHG